VENLVVASASIAGKRRHRRAKTDRRAGHKLLTRLLRHVAGEQWGWSIVRVPSVQEEDRRRLQRAFATAQWDRPRVIKRLKGRLASQGLVMPHRGECQPPLDFLRRWDGSRLPAGRRHRLGQEWAHVKAWAQRIAQSAAERRALGQTAADAAMHKVRQLLILDRIESNSAGGFVMAFFGWRACRHGTEVGALRGAPPTPYASGNTVDERGIATAGTYHIRAMAIDMAWGWLRVQLERALTPWDQRRFGHGSSRHRRRGSVALARQRLMAWWRFVAAGVLPDGAALNAAVPI
jgi:transposase